MNGYLLALFSAINQFAVVNVLAELRTPSRQKVNKVRSAHQLVFGAVILPLMLYVLVSVAGFASCGNQCPDIIVNRQLYGNDYTMAFAKLGLLACLVVGIVMRVNSATSTYIALLNEIRYGHQKVAGGSNPKFQKVSFSQTTSLHKSSDELSEVKFPESSPVDDQNVAPVTKASPLIVLINAGLPALVAAFIRKILVAYVQSAVGFLAPLFIVVFPCKYS